jgi:hypothetical protein
MSQGNLWQLRSGVRATDASQAARCCVVVEFPPRVVERAGSACTRHYDGVLHGELYRPVPGVQVPPELGGNGGGNMT